MNVSNEVKVEKRGPDLFCRCAWVFLSPSTWLSLVRSGSLVRKESSLSKEKVKIYFLSHHQKMGWIRKWKARSWLRDGMSKMIYLWLHYWTHFSSGINLGLLQNSGVISMHLCEQWKSRGLSPINNSLSSDKLSIKICKFCNFCSSLQSLCKKRKANNSRKLGRTTTILSWHDIIRFRFAWMSVPRLNSPFAWCGVRLRIRWRDLGASFSGCMSSTLEKVLKFWSKPVSTIMLVMTIFGNYCEVVLLSHPLFFLSLTA